MAKPSDRVNPLKLESAAEGGDAGDENLGHPAKLNPEEDAMAAAGVYFGEPGKDGSDKLVGVYREYDEMVFEDTNNAGGGKKTLTDLLAGGGITAAQHRTLRQLIHFIDDGPAEGFASGAFKEVTGTVFPSNITWWESSGKTKKIVELDITYTGIVPTTEVWKVYDTDGTTVLATVTDAITYTLGIFEDNRTRTIA